MLDVILKYQTIISASIALCGVIFTITFNARASRKQAERHWIQESAAVRAALCAELNQIKQAMKSQLSRLQKNIEENSKEFLLPLRPMDVSYRLLIPQIGKLNPEEISSIMSAYGQYGIYLDRIHLLGETHNSEHYIKIRDCWRSVIAAHCNYVIERVDDALIASNSKAIEIRPLKNPN